MPDINAIFQRNIQEDNPTGWFEELYAAANSNPDNVPWAKLHPNTNLTEWQTREQRNGTGKSALVVGCGLGDDAEFIAREMGDTVTAFDISETAIAWCQKRWQGSPVTYQMADLLALPDAFIGAFDFVFESYTVQALTPELHEQALHQVAKTVKPGGELLFICFAREEHIPVGNRPPFPLAPSELTALEDAGLQLVSDEQYIAGGLPRIRRVYRKSL